LPGWVERKNKRIHKATFRVPNEVFLDIEKGAMRSLLPSLYDTTMSSYIAVDVKSQPYIQYKSSKYSVPRELCYKTVYYKAIGEKLHIYLANLEHVCTHDISLCKGTVKQLPEHKKQESADWLVVCERLRKRWNCYDFQHFINGFKKENPRHLYKQLSAVEEFLEFESPPKEIVAQLMAECCKKFRYRYTQFQAEYNLLRGQYARASASPQMGAVQYASLDRYQQAFIERSK
jgi:hypothetical protein